MSLRWTDRLRHALSFRLALWYAVVFLASSTALIALTYVLLAASLRRYDRETIQRTLVQYASAYARGGAVGLEREIRASQVGAAPGPFFVRTIGARQDVLFLSIPEAWRRFDLSQLAMPPDTDDRGWATIETGDGGDVLEVASLRFPDGTIFQVGTSPERREEMLRQFRRVLLLDFASIILIGLAGGAVLTASALQPVRTLAETVRRIMRTGRTDARVPAPDTGDALGELSVLVNAMLDRIDAVVAGMRGALDNVAHDLRTPMARLRGIAETALASDDPAVLRDGLGACLEESDRVIEMLNTLMDISEAETGTMALRLEPVDLAELIRQTRELYEDLAEEKHLEIRVTTEGDLVVEVDPNRMRQVLANLVDNAVKYTAAGGRVDITARRVDAEALLTVADNGPGISPDELPRIWERLYRGDKSRSERGLGLGLTLVKAIVEAHGGRVAVDSTVGHGTRFTLTLPGTPEHPSAPLSTREHP